MPKVERIALRVKDAALPPSSVALLQTIAKERTGAVILRDNSGSEAMHAAEAVARTMGRNLVHVDVTQVASRFIGETEKRLDQFFEAASKSGAVLFFDEADALFGKRSDIRDSHDRYANAEIGYLLQKIEAYSGIVILASSGRHHIDPAFLRRLRKVVDLPWPPTSN